jgi:hypothetical protein
VSDVEYETNEITEGEFLALERFARARYLATIHALRGNYTREVSEELIASYNAVCAILIAYRTQVADLRSEAHR